MAASRPNAETVPTTPAQSVLDAAHEAFVSMDAGGFITDWNRHAELTFGWSKEEAVGTVLADTIVPERFREAHLAGLERFLRTRKGPVLGKRLELEGLHRDGHEFPIEITISVVEDQTAPGFHAFLHDISERRLRERYLEAQTAMTLVLAEAESATEAVPRLLEALGGGMGWEFGAFWSPADDRLTCAATWSLPDSCMEGFEALTRGSAFERGAGLPGRVLASGAPAFIEDVLRDDNFPRARGAEEAGLRSAVGLPLLEGGEVRGVIEFLTRGARHPEPELMQMMGTLTAQISRFLSMLSEREELTGRLQRLALTDELTGLPNRRAWDQGLEKEIARARRHGEPICVALIDVDHFKEYNDRSGHQAGDLLLRNAAAFWMPNLRATDLLARYGGDEFALAFPAWPLENAQAVVERLRKSVPEGMTCSAGLAAWQEGERSEELVARADAALYQAKQQGRDRSVVAD